LERIDVYQKPFELEDFEVVNRVLPHFPEVQQAIHVVRRVSDQTEYPIDSFRELAAALGGPDTHIRYRDKRLTLRQVARLIPAYYFPITSQEDLAEKIADIQKHVSELSQVQWQEASSHPMNREWTKPPIPTDEELREAKNSI